MQAADTSPDSCRVSFVLPHLRAGGIERSATLLALQLAKRGWGVRFVLGRAQGPFLAQVQDQAEIVDLGGRRAALAAPRLARLLSGSGDIVYSATTAWNIATLAAMRLMRASNRPVAIISEHTTPDRFQTEARLRHLRAGLMRALYPTADALVAPSDGLAQSWLDALRLDRPMAATLPNPILDKGALSLSDQVVAGQGPSRQLGLIVAVGRLERVKGFDLAIEALAVARRTRPDLHLRILGEGEARASLVAQAQELGLSEAVTFAGFSDAPALELARAELALVPSRREGFGNVVIEALSVGTPVLASACPGPAALLGQVQGAGQTVPIGAPEPMANAMLAMMKDRTWRDMAQRLGPKLARAYSAQATTDAFLGLVADLRRL